MTRTWRLSLAMCAALEAQPVVPRTQPDFRNETKLIVQTVTVTDKSGTVLESLQPSDFSVTEDGEAQDIAFVDFERISDDPETGSLSFPDEAMRRTTGGASPVSPRRGQRRIVLYLDLSFLSAPDRWRIHQATLTFIERGMRPADSVAVFVFDGTAMRVAQDFTNRRDMLVNTVLTHLTGGLAGDIDSAGAADGTGSKFGQNADEFSILNTNRQLSALQTAVEQLGRFQEKKVLVLFSSGVKLNATENQAQLIATTNSAIRANVAVYPVDTQGLAAEPPLGAANSESPRGVNQLFAGRAANDITARTQDRQDAMYALAKDTGGVALFDFNDLSQAITRAAGSITSYYIIGYYTTHPAKDGRFRRTTIALTNGRSATVSTRRGYFAERTFATFTTTEKERQLEEALRLDNPITEIPLAVEVNYFMLNDAEYYVPVTIKLPGSGLFGERRRGVGTAVLDFIGEIRDEHGVTIQNVRDRLPLKLEEELAGRVSNRFVLYQTGFTLLPGSYSLKLLVRESVSGRIGTYQTAVSVPNLLRQRDGLLSSSVVLSNQIVPATKVLANAQKSVRQVSSPLQIKDGQLTPSVTRVFRINGDFRIFLQVYNRSTSEVSRVFAYFAFYRSGKKVFEAPPTLVEGLGRTLTVQLRHTVPALDPGAYECQVTVVDPRGQMAGFWRMPIALAR